MFDRSPYLVSSVIFFFSVTLRENKSLTESNIFDCVIFSSEVQKNRPWSQESYSVLQAPFINYFLGGKTDGKYHPVFRSLVFVFFFLF